MVLLMEKRRAVLQNTSPKLTRERHNLTRKQGSMLFMLTM
jgi:hypothetical protein